MYFKTLLVFNCFENLLNFINYHYYVYNHFKFIFILRNLLKFTIYNFIVESIIMNAIVSFYHLINEY